MSRVESFARENDSAEANKQMRFLYRRAEELAGRFDLIVSRALIPFPAVVELVAHLQEPGGILILWAPRNTPEPG